MLSIIFALNPYTCDKFSVQASIYLPDGQTSVTAQLLLIGNQKITPDVFFSL